MIICNEVSIARIKPYAVIPTIKAACMITGMINAIIILSSSFIL